MEVEGVAATTAPVDLPSDDVRFRVELKFVQLLSNPYYIYSKLVIYIILILLIFFTHYYQYTELVSEGYFNDQSFINYLKYLKYWSKPEYIKYVKYPISLYLLDLLTSNDDYYKRFLDSQFLKSIEEDLQNFTMRNITYYNMQARDDLLRNQQQQQEQQQQQQQQQEQQQ